MPNRLTVSVPDIGEFDAVDVVEVLVAVGDIVEAEQSLVVLESDKATMEVPSPAAGTVVALAVEVGSQVGEGSALCTLEVEGAEASDDAVAAATDATATPASADGATPVSAETAGTRVPLLVLGGGPGGYTAAFRAADLGLDVTLVEREPTLGGVCLNVGCIPSKALLHMAGVIEEAAELGAHGIAFGDPSFDWERIRQRKDEVVGTLTRGLDGLARARKVRVVHGTGRFTGPHQIDVETTDGGAVESIRFENAIVATGSSTVMLPNLPDDPRIVDSTGALEIDGPPGRMLVVGGGIIGLEMATVYLAFGWRVTIVELMDRLMLGVDRDLVRPLEKRLRARCEAIHLGTALGRISAAPAALRVEYEGEGAPPPEDFDRVLVAVGRRANVEGIGLEALGVEIGDRGFIEVDAQSRTGVAHVFAIGDVTGPPQLAHRATHQGKVAAEVCAGHKSAFDARTVPAVAYTDPEVAWAGVTEEEATASGIAFTKGVFPWAASGRAIGIGRTEGLTKLLFDGSSGRLIGAGIVGAHAGELIAEPTLGIEMGADAADLGLTVHAHPTLSETVGFAAEVAEGTATDVPPARKRPSSR